MLWKRRSPGAASDSAKNADRIRQIQLEVIQPQFHGKKTIIFLNLHPFQFVCTKRGSTTDPATLLFVFALSNRCLKLYPMLPTLSHGTNQ
jgi:cAMP phosphodiesterase